MTENMQDMSASAKAAEAPQKENEHHATGDDGQLPKAFTRPSAEELEVARELVRSARERGTALTGPGGLLKALTKTVIETALDEEMTDHLGYDRHDAAGRGSGNSRNGNRTKTVLTDNCGPVEIEVPRDRAGSFDPAIVKKWQRRSGDVDTIVLSLYAKGLTTGEISAHFEEIYGASVSKDTISRITDTVVAEMAEWSARPLEKVYAAIFVDAIYVKVRDGQVDNRPVYAAIGVDLAGHKDVLGLWAGTGGGETAKFWMSVLAELKNRGVADVFFVVCDGLKGLPDSVEAVFPQAVVQTCIIHLIRNTFRYTAGPGKCLIHEIPAMFRHLAAPPVVGLRRSAAVRLLGSLPPAGRCCRVPVTREFPCGRHRGFRPPTENRPGMPATTRSRRPNGRACRSPWCGPRAGPHPPACRFGGD